MDKNKLIALLESKLKDRLQEESLSSIEKRLTTAKKGAKASGGGYSGWVKLSGKTWKNKRTGKMMHSQALASHIGGFNDFKIIGEAAATSGYNVVYQDKALDKTYTAQIPAGISKADIVKMLKKTVRVGLKIISISPIKEAKLEKEKFTDPDQMRMSETNLDPKAKKFLDIIKRSKSIRDLKDVSVQATPKGNWEVSYKGKSLFTMDGKLLDDETIEKHGLRGV